MTLSAQPTSLALSSLTTSSKKCLAPSLSRMEIPKQNSSQFLLSSTRWETELEPTWIISQMVKTSLQWFRSKAHTMPQPKVWKTHTLSSNSISLILTFPNLCSALSSNFLHLYFAHTITLILSDITKLFVKIVGNTSHGNMILLIIAVIVGTCVYALRSVNVL